MSENKQELLPCPFCGGDVKIISGFEPIGGHFVDCDGCGMSGKLVDDKQVAIDAWNRRAVLSASAGEKKDAGWLPISDAPEDGTAIIIANIDEEHGFVRDVIRGYFERVTEDEEDGPWDIRDGEPWCSYVGRAAGLYFCAWFDGSSIDTKWKFDGNTDYNYFMLMPSAPIRATNSMQSTKEEK